LSRSSIRSDISRLSDRQFSKLKIHQCQAKLKELKTREREDCLAELTASRLDDEARRAQQAAQLAINKREKMQSELSRKRKIRKAKYDLVEAEYMEGLLSEDEQCSKVCHPQVDTLPDPILIHTPMPNVVPGVTSCVDQPILTSNREYRPHVEAAPTPTPMPSVVPGTTCVDQPILPDLTELLISSSYGVPRPTLPSFTSGKEKDFAMLKMALDNLVNIHPHLSQQYKYQVLLDKLGGNAKKLAEAYMYDLHLTQKHYKYCKKDMDNPDKWYRENYLLS
jgi:hypothetical protein